LARGVKTKRRKTRARCFVVSRITTARLLHVTVGGSHTLPLKFNITVVTVTWAIAFWQRLYVSNISNIYSNFLHCHEILNTINYVSEARCFLLQVEPLIAKQLTKNVTHPSIQGLVFGIHVFKCTSFFYFRLWIMLMCVLHFGSVVLGLMVSTEKGVHFLPKPSALCCVFCDDGKRSC